MILAAFILVAAFFAVYILLPFWEVNFRRKRLDYQENEKQNLLLRKNEILEAIQDLEYDHKLRKVAEDDYDHLKEDLTREAVEIMKKLDLLEETSGHHEHSKVGS